MNLFFLDRAQLMERMAATSDEVEHLLISGILRPCNFGTRGVPCYRACDVAEARIAIMEAREAGTPLGSGIREPQKVTKEPETVSLDESAEEPEEVEAGQVESLVDALED